MGDAGRTGAVLGGAIILDGYSRAYAVNLAATLSRTPVSQSLTGRLGDVSRSFRSEEHTSELQSLMRTSYAVFCLKKNIQYIPNPTILIHTYINPQNTLQT